jgi:uncharacterized protein (DUF362 family)
VSDRFTELASLALPDGGWGYIPGQAAHFEPTCLSLLALSAQSEKFAATIAAGCLALDRFAAKDGSYHLPRGRAEAIWPTALVLFTRAALGHPNQDRTAERLLTLRGQIVKSDPEIAEMLDIDPKIVGWPWAVGNFSWVEPTAWAMIALRKAGFGNRPEIDEGIRLMLDRSFDEGGINYGNRYVLGKKTDPIPTPTALMLLALQSTGDHPRIASAIRYLKQMTDSTGDLEHLAWTKIAFDAHRGHPDIGDHAKRLDEQIEIELDTTKFTIPIARRALALIALNVDKQNPFKLDAKPQANLNLTVSLPHESTPPLFERVKSKVRKFWSAGIGSFLQQPPSASVVHIADAPDYSADLVAILKKQYESFRTLVPLAGKRVVLKPNLVEYHRDKVINTNPAVIGAMIELCKSEGASEIIVAEGPGHWRNVQFLVEESGLGEVLRQHNVPFVDLNHDEPVKLLNLGRLTGLDHLYMAQTVTTADVLISMPKLKTHHWAGVTLSLKNLFGTLPGICYGWPKNELHWRGISNSIIDIALTNTPHLALVDGIVGMEGDGPLNGVAKPMGVLVMGNDLLAVDATCCRLMGIDPARVPTLILGRDKKLGRLNENEIQQLGEAIGPRVKPFALAPKSDKFLLAKPA